MILYTYAISQKMQLNKPLNEPIRPYYVLLFFKLIVYQYLVVFIELKSGNTNISNDYKDKINILKIKE